MATPARSTRQLQGDESRRRILDATAALMSERGYAGTSISAVVERSGLPASSIYWHFESKEGLLAAVIAAGAGRWFESLPRWEELGGPDDDRHRRMLVATARALEDEPEFLRLLLVIALERSTSDPVSLEAIRRVRDRARAGLRLVIDHELTRRGLPGGATADDLARLTLALADGVFVAHVIDPDDTDVSGLFRLVADALPAVVAAALSADG